MGTPDLAIVIVSYGSARFIPACLRSLEGHTGEIECEVVIADNDPHSGLAEQLAAEFGSVTVVRCENRGFGHANNVGLRATSARHVLFLNPDTELRGGELASLVARIDGDRSLGVLGCRQVDPRGELCPSIRRFPSVGRALAEALGSERLLGRRSPGLRELRVERYAAETRCDWVSGSFMLVRREALDAVGAFDERFFLFSEEVDLCLRITRAGWAVRHSPRLEIMHHAGKAGIDSRLAAQQAFAQRQYADKHFAAPRRAAFLTVLGAGYALRGLAARAPGRASGDRRDAAAASLRTLAGITPPPFGAPA